MKRLAFALLLGAAFPATSVVTMTLYTNGAHTNYEYRSKLNVASAPITNAWVRLPKNAGAPSAFIVSLNMIGTTNSGYVETCIVRYIDLTNSSYGDIWPVGQVSRQTNLTLQNSVTAIRAVAVSNSVELVIQERR